MHTFLKILWVRKNLILGCILLSFLFGIQVISFRKNTYTAKATFIAQSDFYNFAQQAWTVNILPMFDEIIKKHKLLENPEFNKMLAADKSIAASLLLKFRHSVFTEDPDEVRRGSVQHLSANFNRQLIPATRILEISYTSLLPRLSVEIVQDFSDKYTKKLGDHYRIYFYDKKSKDMDCRRFLENKNTYTKFLSCLDSLQLKNGMDYAATIGEKRAIILIKPQVSTIPDRQENSMVLFLFTVGGAVAGMLAGFFKDRSKFLEPKHP